MRLWRSTTGSMSAGAIRHTRWRMRAGHDATPEEGPIVATLIASTARREMLGNDALRQSHRPQQRLGEGRAGARASGKAVSRDCGKYRMDVFRQHHRSPFEQRPRDRKSTRLNSSHVASSYAVF